MERNKHKIVKIYHNNYPENTTERRKFTLYLNNNLIVHNCKLITVWKFEEECEEREMIKSVEYKLLIETNHYSYFIDLDYYDYEQDDDIMDHRKDEYYCKVVDMLEETISTTKILIIES